MAGMAGSGVCGVSPRPCAAAARRSRRAPSSSFAPPARRVGREGAAGVVLEQRATGRRCLAWRGEANCSLRPASGARRSDSGCAAGPRGAAHGGLPRVEGRRSRHRVAAKAGLTKEIPIFPLNMVAMPYAITPLHIFEARYRVMFSTILQGEPGVEEGLVDEDSPFAGSREFGMCLTTQQGMATVGTTLRVEEFSHLPDGRLLVTNKGVERFKVLDVVRESPYVVCRVEVLEDEDYGMNEVRNSLTKALTDSPAVDGFDGPVSSGEEAGAKKDGGGSGGDSDDDVIPQLELPGDDWAEGGVQHLSGEVSTLLKDTIRLTAKMNGSEEPELPPEFTQLELDPHRFSFWVASVFSAPAEQQHILEMLSTSERLKREKDVLTSTLDYLKASTAIKGVFKDEEGTVGRGDGEESP